MTERELIIGIIVIFPLVVLFGLTRPRRHPGHGIIETSADPLGTLNEMRLDVCEERSCSSVLVLIFCGGAALVIFGGAWLILVRYILAGGGLP